MTPCRFEVLFGNNHTINIASPEWRFMNSITERRPSDAVSLFGDKRYYGVGEMYVDTPYGRFEGLDAINNMANGWLDAFQAVSAKLVPVTQTRAGSRSVTEMVLYYTTADGESHAVPMAALADLKGKNQMDALRVYYHWRSVPGLPAYRPPLFPERKDHTTRQEMISGAIGDYMRLLHSPDGGIIDHANEVFSDMVAFGGYEPENQTDEFVLQPRSEFIGHFNGNFNYTLSKCVHLGIETITDDGRICCVEWEQIVTTTGRAEQNRISQAGIAFYERDEFGKIWSARVIDYAHSEDFIDWSIAPVTKERALEWNLVEE